MPLDAVIFDVGGVLVDWNPRHLYRGLIGDDAAVEAFLTEVCTPEWNAEMDRGKPVRQAVAELSSRFPDRAELIAAWGARWPDMLRGPIDGAVEVLRDLRAAGRVRLLALTNFSLETWPVARERYPFLGWFEDILVSAEVGVAKPDPAIFDLAARRFGVETGRTLFVDDADANVEAARASGFRAVRFTTPQALRRVLESLGALAEPSDP